MYVVIRCMLNRICNRTGWAGVGGDTFFLLWWVSRCKKGLKDERRWEEMGEDISFGLQLHAHFMITILYIIDKMCIEMKLK